MNKIKIVHIITKLELGGAQKNALDIVSNLDKKKYDIYLFSGKDGLLIEDAKNIAGLQFIAVPHLIRKVNPVKDFLAFFSILSYLKKIRPDIVHTHSSKAGIIGRFAARLADVPFIYHTVHGFSFNLFQPRFINFLYVFFERMAGRFTSKIIVVSSADKEKGLRHHIGCQNKYLIIPYGIEMSKFAAKQPKEKVRKDLCLPVDRCVVGIIACFKPQKGLFDFVKACHKIYAEFPDAIFLMIGDGVLRKQIEDLIASYKLRNSVILLGWRRDIDRILNALDIFVLSSLWEGLPISFLEASSASLPIVATNVGGASEVIKDGYNGFLVEPSDWGALADRIKKLMNDEGLRREMGKNSFNKITSSSKFEIGNMLRELNLLYESSIYN